MALTGMFGTISTVLTPGFSSPWELAAMVATVGLTATAAVKMYRSGLVKRDS
jgi:hypothetical protein